MVYVEIMGTLGKMMAGIHEDGSLFGLWFDNQKYFPNIPRVDMKLESDARLSEEVNKTLNKLKSQLEAYSQGQLKSFDLKLAPQGTAFQKLIWQLLLDIPYGKTSCYGELGKLAASKLGKKTMSAQAVGGAVGHNPIAIIIPCHRVIGKDGSLTGYAGGIEKKVSLLQIEALENDFV
jgi:methylated-DNA-[protein]-cysteine S-methyltransferase